ARSGPRVSQPWASSPPRAVSRPTVRLTTPSTPCAFPRSCTSALRPRPEVDRYFYIGQVRELARGSAPEGLPALAECGRDRRGGAACRRRIAVGIRHSG